MKRVKLLLLISLAAWTLLPRPSLGASFFIQNQGGTTPLFVMEGAIEVGDGDKLLALIKSNPVDTMLQKGMSLNSPGGSVSEAIKIAQIIESAAIKVRVHSGDVCASACFIIFASAPYRWASNDAEILIHRPYFEPPLRGSREYEYIVRAQQEAITDMRNYLQARSVPSALIDRMMYYPSGDAYQLTVVDIYDGMGSMSTVIEEMTLRECGLTNSNIFRRGDATQKEANEDRACISRILFSIADSWISELLGAAEYEAVRENTTERMRRAGLW